MEEPVCEEELNMEEEKQIEEMNEKELLAILVKEQTKSSRNGKILIAIMGVIAAIALIAAILVVPKAVKTLDDTNELISQGETLVLQGQNSLSEIDIMIGDMQSVAGNLNKLVDGNMEVIEDSLGKINNIDFESLNRSIKNLADVLQPLANFFNIF